MSTEDTPKPVAWLVCQGSRDYYLSAADFARSSYDNGQFSPLFDQTTIDAAVAKERERCAMAVVDYSLSYPFDENDRSLFDECAQYVRDGVLPSA